MVSINRHLYSYPCLNLLQMGLGVCSLTFDTLNRFLMETSRLKLPVQGEATFINTPESGTATIAVGLTSSSLTQLFQRQVAMPPAEAPVSTTFSAFWKLYLSTRYLKWDLVLQAPLKKSSASLYLMLFQLAPWWKAPSQYCTNTLVQLANLLFQGSVERQPPKVASSLRFLLLPQSVLLRWQQLSMTCATVASPQAPPPLKKMMNLLGSLPWWMQRAGGEPSTHLALGSVLWMTFLQGCSRARRVAMRQTKRRVFIKIIGKGDIQSCRSLIRYARNILSSKYWLVMMRV